MNKEVFQALKERGVFDIPTLEMNIEKLAAALDDSFDLNALNDKYILLAIPSLDKKGRSLREENRDMYYSQSIAVQDLHVYLTQGTDARVLGVARKADDAGMFADISGKEICIDYLFLFYDFSESERRYIEEKIRKNYLDQVVNKDLKIIELGRFNRPNNVVSLTSMISSDK